MARTEARIFTDIWDNDDFLALGPDAQLLYVRVLTDKALSFCGVRGLTLNAWASDLKMSIARVRTAVKKLDETRFFVVDERTEEVLVRTLVKHDGVLDAPNFIVRMSHDFSEVRSTAIRAAILAEIPPDFVEQLPIRFEKAWAKGLWERLSKGFRELLSNPLSCVPTRVPPAPIPPDENADASSSSDPSGRDDDDPIFSEALKLWADRKMIGQSVLNRPAYRAKVMSEDRVEFGPLRAAHLDLDLDALLLAFEKGPEDFAAHANAEMRAAETRRRIILGEIQWLRDRNDDGGNDAEIAELEAEFVSLREAAGIVELAS